jgi:hypothetical protein
MGSPLTFSRKLEDVGGCATVLQRLARIERLPPGDGREALAVLRVAWDKTDLFNSLAGRYKARPPPLCPQLRPPPLCPQRTPPAPPLSPSCLLHAPGASWAAEDGGGRPEQALSLVLFSLVFEMVAAIPAVLLVHATRPDLLPTGAALNAAVIVLAGVALLCAGVALVLSPTAKWRRLRGAALDLESEVWRFRTRTGVYAAGTRAAKGKDAAQRLQARVNEITQFVVRAGTVMGTDFLARFEGYEPQPAARSPARPARPLRRAHPRQRAGQG